MGHDNQRSLFNNVLCVYDAGQGASGISTPQLQVGVITNWMIYMLPLALTQEFTLFRL